jgi:hypothetical protein
MLGELLGETTGRRTGRRVLSVDPANAEVSFEESGKMLGVSANGFGTYLSTMRKDGSLYGEGQGVIMTQEGDMIAWKGSGIGKFKEKGAVSYRGMLYYSTNSQKLARLNNAAGVFEYEVDPDGKTQTKVWEWK